MPRSNGLSQFHRLREAHLTHERQVAEEEAAAAQRSALRARFVAGCVLSLSFVG